MNYLLLGSETYNVRQRCQALISANVGHDDGMNVVNYRPTEEVTAQQVIDDCQTVPFLGDHKVVIWQNPAFLTGGRSAENDAAGQTVKEYLKNPNGSTVLIICAEGTIDRRRKIFTEIRALAKTEEYDELSAEQFRDYVGGDLRASGLKMDRAAFDILISRLPPYIGNWKQELAKLSLYPGTLDKKAVRALVAKPLEDDIFELSNAIVGHDLSKAMQVYHDLTVLNKNDPSSLMGLIAYQFRFMCQAVTLARHGCAIDDIAQQLACKPYRVQMTLRSASGMTPVQLLEILFRMARLDQMVKAGRVDRQVGMEMLILDLTRR